MPPHARFAQKAARANGDADVLTYLGTEVDFAEVATKAKEIQAER